MGPRKRKTARVNQTFTRPARPPDYMDASSSKLAGQHLSARELYHLALQQTPGWFELLFQLRNWIGGKLGLRNGRDEFEPDDASKTAYLMTLLPVLEDRDNRFVTGIGDRHLDFLITLEKVGKASEQVSMKTEIWFNAWYGRLYLWLIMPFHKFIIHYLTRKLSQPETYQR